MHIREQPGVVLKEKKKKAESSETSDEMASDDEDVGQNGASETVPVTGDDCSEDEEMHVQCDSDDGQSIACDSYPNGSDDDYDETSENSDE